MVAFNTIRKELAKQGAMESTLNDLQTLVVDLQEAASRPHQKIIEEKIKIVPDTQSKEEVARLRLELEQAEERSREQVRRAVIEAQQREVFSTRFYIARD